MFKSNHKSVTILLQYLTVVILIVIAILLLMKKFEQPIDKFERVPQPKTLLSFSNTNQQISEDRNKHFLLLYSPTCPDCKKVQPKLAPQVAKLQAKNSLVLVNTKIKAMRPFVKFLGVTDIPTLVLMHHGKVVYMYSGTDYFKIKRLLNNHFPETNKLIPNETPHIQIIQNDFSHIEYKEPSINTADFIA